MAEALRNDTEAPMDYLRDIVGMDWGEEYIRNYDDYVTLIKNNKIEK